MENGIKHNAFVAIELGYKELICDPAIDGLNGDRGGNQISVS